MKKKGLWALIAGCLIILVVISIVSRAESSSFAHFVQWLSGKIEGFAVAGIDSDIPRCPDSYRFFNDMRGESFCCAGAPDPYKHTCSYKGADDLCAFKPRQTDPRNPNKELPLCADIVRRQQARKERDFCPKSLPNHANVGKCCLNPSNPTSGDCHPSDSSDTRNYCITQGALKAGETRCLSLRLMEESTCPDGFQKNMTRLAGDVTGPVCYNLEKRGFCFPENSIDEIQRQGLWKNKNKHTWIEACGVWSKVNIDRDTTIHVDYSPAS